MTAAVETMAYTNEVPWHGLGTFKANGWKNVKSMLTDAGIDWKVNRSAMYTADGAEVEGFSALTRSSDGKVLDVVGGRYQPVQNEDAFEFFTEFVEAGKAKMETAGSLMGGRIVWGLAKLGTGFKLKNQDQVDGYLLCMCPHKKGKSLLYKTTAIRVVCNNTLTMALRTAGNEWRMSHRTVFDGVKIEEAKTALGIARDQIGEFETTARKLQKVKVTDKDVRDILSPIFVKDGTEESRRMKQLIDIYERAPGADPGNAWGVLNAVSYYADHIASRSTDKRLSNAWIGRTAMQKTQTLEKLLELV